MSYYATRNYFRCQPVRLVMGLCAATAVNASIVFPVNAGI